MIETKDFTLINLRVQPDGHNINLINVRLRGKPSNGYKYNEWYMENLQMDDIQMSEMHQGRNKSQIFFRDTMGYNQHQLAKILILGRCV